MSAYASKKLLDQAEAFALRDQLLLRARFLSASLETATGKKIPEPAFGTGTDAVFEAISTLESHCALLQSEINAACAGAKQTSTATTPTPSAQPAKKETGAKTPTTKAPAWNPDAKILEARGVKTLDELNALGPSDESKD